MGRKKKTEEELEQERLEEEVREFFGNQGKDFEDDFFEVNEDVEMLVIDSITASKSQLATVKNPSRQDIKTMVKLFYDTQRCRKNAANVVRDAKKNESEELIVNAFMADALDYAKIEKNISNQLKALCNSSEVGRWLLSIKGIGPVLAAGLIAYFDVTRAKYATNFISYAGLNDNNRPWLGAEKSRKILDEILNGRKEITDDDVIQYATRTQWKYNYLLEKAYNQNTGKWSKTELVKAASRIPYNAQLKTLVWKVGKSFEWVKNKPDSLYGKILNERLIYENWMNDHGKYVEQAKANITNKNIGKETETYKFNSEGKLSPSHINARALRYTTKIFISHLFEEMYRVENDEIPPRYYALEHLEGQHNIDILPEVPFTKVSSEKTNPQAVNIDGLKLFLDKYLEELDSEEEVEELLNNLRETAKAKRAARKAENSTEESKTTKKSTKKETKTEEVEVPKKKRGRPKKVVEEPVVEAPKKKRGRPRKNQDQ